MAEEVKPIKTERIDNPDGTYTVKEIYDKPNFDYYLSNIETFNKNNKMISGTYYDDKNFKKLLCTERREYIENGYYRIIKYTKPRKHDAIFIKCLCDNNDNDIKTWYYADTECNELLIYSETEHFEDKTSKSRNIWYKDNFYNELYQDSNNLTLKEIIYIDADFTNKLSTEEYTYNDDGSYICKIVTHEYIDDDSCHSGIAYCDKEGHLIKSEAFFDNNFCKLHSYTTAKYLKDGSYITKISYEKCDENGWKSTIEKYDKNNNFLSGEYYKEKDFKNIGQKTIRKYYKNGNYKYIYKRTVPTENGWYDCEELYDKYNRYLSGICKTGSKEPNQIIMNDSNVYNADNSYTYYVSYQKQDCDKNYLSYKEEYDNNARCMSSEFYKDRKYKQRYWSCERKYIKDNHYIDSIVTTDCTDNNEQYKSYTEEVNSDENWEKNKFYKNEDFTDLLASTYKYKNQNGNTEKQILYENDQNGWCSTIYEREKDTNRRLKQIWYVDKEFQNLYTEGYATYNEDGYTVKLVYHKQKKEFGSNIELCSRIEYYNKNNKIVKRCSFKDKEFSQLYATDTYEYLKNKTVIRKTRFKEMHENHQSGIEYSNKKEEVVFCKSYTDKDFKNLYRTTWIKYKQKGKILLRIYAQKQNQYSSEIEKYDKNKNLIYKKQYKFKGILAHILFWLAR